MKIEELITYIKENFPMGCEGISCKDCPLNDKHPGSVDGRLCNFLQYVDECNWEDQL